MYVINLDLLCQMCAWLTVNVTALIFGKMTIDVLSFGVFASQHSHICDHQQIR